MDKKTIFAVSCLHITVRDGGVQLRGSYTTFA